MGETALADTGTNAVHCKAVQHGDGLYVVEFVPLVRGEFLVNVTARSGAFGGRKLGNLPGSVVVQVDSAPNPNIYNIYPNPNPNPNPSPSPNPNPHPTPKPTPSQERHANWRAFALPWAVKGGWVGGEARARGGGVGGGGWI